MDKIKLFKALSDSSRLNILNSLMESPKYVEVLSTRLKLSKSTVSFHLKKLEEANLVTKKKEQYYIIYSVNPEIFSMKLSSIIKIDKEKLEDEKVREEEYKLNIINEYIEEGKLKSIPVQRKKKIIVLKKITEIFDLDIYYSEAEVTNELEKIYADPISLRRELIKERILSRSRGYYLRED